MKGYGSLREVEQEWSFDDLIDAHEVIRQVREAEREAAER